ncbi:MAG: ABC transporter permease [Flavitalea sp.]
MFQNYFKVAIRNLFRHKSYTAINVAGLSIGIAASLLLFLVIRYEYSYDTFQKNYSKIHQFVMDDKLTNGEHIYNPGSPFPALQALRAEFPTMKIGTLLSSNGSQITILKNDPSSGIMNPKYITENGLIYADPELFQVLDYKWLKGQPSILAEPNVVVLTRAAAEKYYGSIDAAMGKSLMVDNLTTMQVSGIIETPPANTDFPMETIGSFETYKKIDQPYGYMPDWGFLTSSNVILTRFPDNVTRETVEKKLEAYSARVFEKSNRREYRKTILLPLSDVHFDTRFHNLGDHIISRNTLNILSFIAVLIIVMASINFVNLSTAQAVGRSREVGVRKVLGSSRPQLFRQMMGETGLIVIISIAISLVIAFVAIPFVKNIVSINEELKLISVATLIFLAIVFVAVTFFSGVYPSLVLSGFKPALALKNKITSANVGGISLRRGLVVLQFGISQILVIGTIIAVSQMNYVKNADIGFNKEAVFVMNSTADSALIAKREAFKMAVLQLPGVQSLSYSSDIPSSDNNSASNFGFDLKNDNDFDLFLKFGDEDYFKTYGLQIIAGRALAKTDTLREAVVNETLIAKLGLKKPEDVLGKKIRFGGNIPIPVVGVVKDFKTNSLRESVKPLMISSVPEFYTVTAVKLRSTDIDKASKAIQKTWDRYFPEYANTSEFMDETIDNFYQQENQLSNLYKIFAGLAIFISCLGLYGLVSFLAIQKTKEVGIRKVLGASVGNIVYLFSKEFTILIAVAFCIAAPIGWFMMNKWLEDFQFKISIGAGVFVLAIFLSMMIAWVTVGYKAVKAALANPVKSIRAD